MFGFLKKILGSKSDKDLKEIYPLVDKINTEFDKLKGISDEDLRGKTESFKLKIKESLKAVSYTHLTLPTSDLV